MAEYTQVLAYQRATHAALPRERYPEVALSAVVHYVGRARRAIQERDVPGAHAALSDAQGIVALLRGALNFQDGGDLAQRLDRIYDFVSARLGEANVAKDAALLEPVPEILRPLCEAYAQAAATHLRQRTAAAVGGGKA